LTKKKEIFLRPFCPFSQLYVFKKQGFLKPEHVAGFRWINSDKGGESLPD
jgi:hypothetical protein